MKKILVISDPHITLADETIIGLDTLARLKAVLTAACTDHPDAQALILLGDLAHHGQTAAYARLRDALADVPFPLVPLLGNHDRRDAFLSVFPDAPQTAEGFIQTSLKIGAHRIITLDTLDGPPYPHGQHSGWLCQARLDWLDAQLRAAKDKPVLVIAHHPPHDTGIAGMDPIKLRNGTALTNRLAAHGSAYLLCGHLHRTVSGVSNRVPWTIFKSTGHQGPLDLHNPDSSLSIDEPPSYGVVLLSDDSVIVHSQDLIADVRADRDPTSISG